jgi:hypothetical protein
VDHHQLERVAAGELGDLWGDDLERDPEQGEQLSPARRG